MEVKVLKRLLQISLRVKNFILYAIFSNQIDSCLATKMNPILLYLPPFHRFIWHSNMALKSVLRYFIFGGKWHGKIIFKFGLSIMQVLCPRHLIPEDTVTFKESTVWNTGGKIEFSALLDYLPQAPSYIFHCFFFFGTISFHEFLHKDWARLLQ